MIETISFKQTRKKLVKFRNDHWDHGAYHQSADTMIGVCDDVIGGRYEISEHDPVGRGFIEFCQAHHLIVHYAWFYAEENDRLRK